MAWKEYCVEYMVKELQESMDMCTGCCDKTEILLKTALNTIQSFNYHKILVKGESAGNQNFLLGPQCFPLYQGELLPIIHFFFFFQFGLS